MALPKKLPVEFLSDARGADGKRKLVARFVIAGFATLDEALARAKGKAKVDGRRVLSANFRVGKSSREVDAIVVHVQEG